MIYMNHNLKTVSLYFKLKDDTHRDYSTKTLDLLFSLLQELVSQLERPCSRPAERLHLIYASKLPPKWEIQVFNSFSPGRFEGNFR